MIKIVFVAHAPLLLLWLGSACAGPRREQTKTQMLAADGESKRKRKDGKRKRKRGIKRKGGCKRNRKRSRQTGKVGEQEMLLLKGQ